MDIKTKQYLIDLYNKLPYRNKDTCLKFCYEYNGVNVNLYFDAFDSYCISFSMILSFNKKYYYTPLNILETNQLSEYLPKINKEILQRILVDNKLENFFFVMQEKLLTREYKVINYIKDTYYCNTLKFNNSEEDLLFLRYPKKVRMANNTLSKLYLKCNIPFNVLQKIQRSGYTLVRTNDPKLRTQLTFILNQIGITIE